ncbi:type 2 lantibiotic biosynthesis LanM family protein [Bacillus cereus ATCC 4342]|uniref:type 2 lanthipeptide synthetase LanM family protein n=1 Tax=Bacillus tropicus TaxID=2026188 RepID=UPI0001A0145F|nr:type 2 lanthipeptide synthetase LanM family protein [Bacillus tropicus]AJH71606.1 type 2 lantibiotic biosynthesis LanM family protein [Bacillus cereus ATCC 4342]EEK81125.1 Lantibiotic mersacidin modifying enzyme [Bacillus cereus ATCC 4342]KFM89783.1 type 2 lantibiotic biosynthesis LanM family protein [Bacillus cereus ATCC 4342]MDE7553010.1 type 2 lanthipeptide synthetase LanM family protein [Bacillus tropicus]MDE7574166.1 type 2 lanthipeptide synthetase LanM family protein [Bacillus tropicu
MTLQHGTYLLERENKENIFDEERYQKWLSKTGLNESIIDTLIQENNIELEYFKTVLSNKENPELNTSLEWIAIVNRLINDNTYYNKDIEYLEGFENIPFFAFYVPFFNYSLEVISNKFKGVHEEKIFSINIENITKSILLTVADRIGQIGLKVLITEINMARTGHLLSGETEKERYASFINEFLQDKEYIQNLFNSYPVMVRLMVETVHSTVDAMFEIVYHYAEDRDQLVAIFGGDFNTLTSIDLGAGDTHQNGRTVAMLNFNNKRKLVYKPRSLKTDELFNELLIWINKKGFKKPLKNLTVLSRDEYGYQEFISGSECNTQQEVENFYYRQGGYIALFYILNSTDFHHENIIADGEYPIFIDLETLFSNSIEFNNELTDNKSAFLKLSLNIKDSVFQSLMLPVKFSDDPLIDYDLSGLGISGELEVEPSAVNALDNVYSDQIKMVKQKVKLKEFNNTPRIKQKKTNASDYIQEIINGFTDMYKLILNNKQEFTLDNGPLYAFKNTFARQVFRATEAYARFVSASIHPNYLKNGIDREGLFYYLWHGINHQPKFSRIAKYEIQDLLRTDIPYFTFKVGSTSLFNSDKIEIKDFFDKTSIDVIKEKLNKLSDIDHDQQVEFIKQSLGAIATNEQKEYNPYGYKEVEKSLLDTKEYYKDQFLNEAKKIGDEIVNRAIVGDNFKDALWFGLNLDNNEQFKLSPISIDLYNGSLGIVLFLGILAKETNDEKYKKYAVAGLNYIENKLAHTKLQSTSAFSGYSSLSYVYAYLGKIWSDQKLINQSREYINKIDSLLIKNETTYDFVGGLSGSLLVLVRLYEEFNFTELKPICDLIAQKLLNQASNQIKTNTLLTGLAHGASGYAWPLLEYAYKMDQNHLLNDILAILNYENSKVNDNQDNWLDLRENESFDAPAFWCHGAGGIGISRLMMSQIIENTNINGDLQKCINVLMTKGFGTSNTLCHGDFGNLDFLLTYAQVTKNNEYIKISREIGRHVLKQKEENGQWNLDQHGDVNILGFMIGISGIGFELLRLNNPNIPSVLSLDLP